MSGRPQQDKSQDSRAACQPVIGRIDLPAGVVGAVFASSEFTYSAKMLNRYVAPETILLWDGAEVTLALQKRKMREGLLAKYRFAVEYGFADGDLERIWT